MDYVKKALREIALSTTWQARKGSRAEAAMIKSMLDAQGAKYIIIGKNLAIKLDGVMLSAYFRHRVAMCAKYLAALCVKSGEDDAQNSTESNSRGKL